MHQIHLKRQIPPTFSKSSHNHDFFWMVFVYSHETLSQHWKQFVIFKTEKITILVYIAFTWFTNKYCYWEIISVKWYNSPANQQLLLVQTEFSNNFMVNVEILVKKCIHIIEVIKYQKQHVQMKNHTNSLKNIKMYLAAHLHV